MFSILSRGFRSISLLVCLLLLPVGLMQASASKPSHRPAASAQSLCKWNTFDSPGTYYLNGIHMLSENDGWAVGTKGFSNGTSTGPIILRWNGTTWSTAFETSIPYELLDVDVLDANNAWAVGGQWGNPTTGMVLRWDGSVWNLSTGLTGYWRSVSVVSNTDVWAAGSYQYISTSIVNQGSIRSHWNGSIWNTVTLYDKKGMNAVSMLTTSEGWMVGWDGVIRHWNGTGWSSVTSPITTDLQAVTTVSDTDAWAVGVNGRIVRWNGESWAEVASPATETLTSVDMVSASDGWAVGANGTILHWDGNAWSQVSSPITTTLRSVSMISAQDGWAVGIGGTILRCTPEASKVYIPLIMR
jgi:hypothetical protein